jgi:N-acetylglucosaminyldiphosphoundecaprenol N-acetyl-beta-D-mannosaminyltransferase
MKTVQFLSFSIVDACLSDVVNWCMSKPRVFRRIVTLNPLMLMSGPSFRDWIGKANLVVPDGCGICKALRKIEQRHIESITGIDIVQALLARGASCYLVGARVDVVEKASKVFGNQVLGYSDGFQPVAAWDGIVEDIKTKEPDFIFVGMGFPTQESFIQLCEKELVYGTAIGVGGSIDVLSGEIKRAPSWVCALQLEWLYRAIREPRRFKQFFILFRFYRKYC